MHFHYLWWNLSFWREKSTPDKSNVLFLNLILIEVFINMFDIDIKWYIFYRHLNVSIFLLIPYHFFYRNCFFSKWFSFTIHTSVAYTTTLYSYCSSLCYVLQECFVFLWIINRIMIIPFSSVLLSRYLHLFCSKGRSRFFLILIVIFLFSNDTFKIDFHEQVT